MSLTTDKRLTECWGLADPDEVGSSEYRAVYECLTDGLISQDEDDPDESPSELILGMLDEFIGWAKEMKETIRESDAAEICGCGRDPDDCTQGDCECGGCRDVDEDCDDMKERLGIKESGPPNNCAKCGLPLGVAKQIWRDTPDDGGEWLYCSAECMETH